MDSSDLQAQSFLKHLLGLQQVLQPILVGSVLRHDH